MLVLLQISTRARARARKVFSFGREVTFISDWKLGRMRDKNKQENFTIEELKVIKTHDKTLIFRMECEDRIKKLRNRPPTLCKNLVSDFK